MRKQKGRRLRVGGLFLNSAGGNHAEKDQRGNDSQRSVNPGVCAYMGIQIQVELPLWYSNHNTRRFAGMVRYPVLDEFAVPVFSTRHLVEEFIATAPPEYFNDFAPAALESLHAIKSFLEAFQSFGVKYLVLDPLEGMPGTYHPIVELLAELGDPD
jgi:hypothetical protein